MDKATHKIVAEYIRLAQKSYPEIIDVYIFGSYASDNAKEESDIDLALIFNQLEDQNRFDVQVKLMLIASQVDSRIEPHPISAEDFKAGNPFVEEIKKNGYPIIEDAI